MLMFAEGIMLYYERKFSTSQNDLIHVNLYILNRIYVFSASFSRKKYELWTLMNDSKLMMHWITRFNPAKTSCS